MNLFDMTRDDWILFGLVIVALAIPSIIKPSSLWLGKKLRLVKADAVEEGIQAMQEVAVPGSGSEADATAADGQADGQATENSGGAPSSESAPTSSSSTSPDSPGGEQAGSK